MSASNGKEDTVDDAETKDDAEDDAESKDSADDAETKDHTEEETKDSADDAEEETKDDADEAEELDASGNPVTVDKADTVNKKDCKYDLTVDFKEKMFGKSKDPDISCSKDYTVQLYEDVFNLPKDNTSLIDNILYFLPIPPPVKLAITTAKDFAFDVAIPLGRRIVPIGQKIAASPLLDKQMRQTIIKAEVNKLGNELEKKVITRLDKVNAWAEKLAPKSKNQTSTDKPVDKTGGSKAYFTHEECSFF